MNRSFFSLAGLLGILTLFLSLSVSYTLWQYFEGLGLVLPDYFKFLAMSVTTFAVYWVGWNLYIHIYWRLTSKGRRFDLRRSKLLSETMDVLEHIAKGDFSVMVDINEQDPFYEVGENVNKMVRELGSMEKMRQDFISNISHEIQSPLTAISGFAALLKEKNLSPEQVAHYSDIIETESRRLSRLSDNLLRLSNLEGEENPLKISTFALNKQLEGILLMLEPQWSGKDLVLEATLPKTTIEADEDLLSQVFINLIQNAIKFTPSGGSLKVAISQNEDWTRVSVEDSGIGISEKDQLRVFERFYKVDQVRDRSFGGSGLGLSIVSKIVKLHGGQVTLKSALGKGTCFYIGLPRKKEL